MVTHSYPLRIFIYAAYARIICRPFSLPTNRLLFMSENVGEKQIGRRAATGENYLVMNDRVPPVMYRMD